MEHPVSPPLTLPPVSLFLCLLIHFFPPSFSSNIHKHSATQSRETRAKRQRHRNIITQLLQSKRDGGMNSHLLWPKNFCPTSSHFSSIRTGVMLLLSLLSSPRGCERLKPNWQLPSQECRNQQYQWVNCMVVKNNPLQILLFYHQQKFHRRTVHYCNGTFCIIWTR